MLRPVTYSRLLTALSALALSACARAHPATAPLPAHSTMTEPEAVALTGKTLMVPVAGIAPARLQDTYTAARGGEIHAALDILAKRGTPVVAADNGTILRLRQNAAGGITIYQLDASEHFVYYYAHLDHYRRGLSEGMRVHQGEVLGYVGTTGNAPPDTPHLHFQLMRYLGNGHYSGGEPLDPLPFLVKEGKSR